MNWKVLSEDVSSCGQWQNLRVLAGARTFWIGWSIPEKQRWAVSKDRTDLERRFPGILYDLRQVVQG